jgi:Fe-S-cluster-containing hydrogenase component 2
MQKKILIDLEKCRDCVECKLVCPNYYRTGDNGVKSLREMAVFRYTCRKCEEAPCIQVCPSQALERDHMGNIGRSINLCVACKSCVTICPFGTLMNDFFDYKTAMCNLCLLEEPDIYIKCLGGCEKHAIEITEREENEKEHIYALLDRVLIKEYCWDKLKNEPIQE